MACETIKMEISANPDFVSIIRLTTSGIANKIGFSIDDIEDMKVAVSEACTNAIKHSSDDRFYITFNILDDGLNIEIKDNGIGIKILDKLGNEFYTTKNYGTGLGVSFSKHIIDLHNGDIKYISYKDGTTVKISLQIQNFKVFYIVFS